MANQILRMRSTHLAKTGYNDWRDVKVKSLQVAMLRKCQLLLLLVLPSVMKKPILKSNKMLSYRRETELQGALVFVKSGRLELG